MMTQKQRGVGLIEVLIAFLVVGLGIIALVKLEGVYLQSSGESKTRTVALSLAQEKLDDLKGFTKLDSDPNQFDYLDIGNNAGGALSGGALIFPSGSVASSRTPNSNVSYSIGWTVDNGYWTGSPPALTYTAPSPLPPYPDQKRITVTVSWTDEKNVTQNAQLQGIVTALSPSVTNALARNSGGTVPGSPQVFYSPSSAAEVVAIGVGSNNTKRETLIPTANGSEQVKFTAYTYTSSGQLLRQEDFLTVSCNCAFTTAGQARTPSYARWDTTANTYKDQEGDLVSKDKGCVTNGNNANCVNNADALCTACCEDHHDTGTSAQDTEGVTYCNPSGGILDRCFDPFRGTGDFTNGKHNHYTSNGSQASSGQYLESCRMKRINGYWRVYQDWHRVELSAFPLNTLTSSTDEATYASYVGHIIDDILNDTTHVLDSNDATSTTHGFYGQDFTRPTTSPGSGTKPTVIERSVANSNPVSLTVNQLLHITARAVYVDYLSPSLLTEVRAKKSSSQDYLIHVPFYEVDVTDRAPKCASATNAYGGWCPPASNEVDVGTGNIANNQTNGLDAGVIKGVSATTSPVNVSFAFRRSNSGLMGLSDPIDVADVRNSDRRRNTALVAVSVSGTAASTHTLNVSLTGDTPTSGSLSFTPASGSGDVCSGSGTAYSCTVPNSTSGTLSFTGSNGSYTCTGTGSYPASTANTQNVTLTISCVPPAVTTHTMTVTLNPTGGTPSTGTLTSTQATGCSGSGLAYSCTEADTVAGTAILSYSGQTVSGGSCTGSASYTASSTAPHSETLNVTCVSTRVLSVCLYGTSFSSGSLTATPSGGSAINCSTPNGSCGSGSTAGIGSSCQVTSGLDGSLSFSGLTTGNRVCTGSSTYQVTDSVKNVEIACSH